MFEIPLPVGRTPIDGPKPFRVEYPFGEPGDGFRRLCVPGKATCVAYHRNVDPQLLAGIRNGNKYRYGPGDKDFDDMVADMRENGYRGGDGGRIIIYVSNDDVWIGEGNHRLRASMIAEVPSVELEIRYLCRADEDYLLIPFDPSDPDIKVYAD